MEKSRKPAKTWRRALLLLICLSLLAWLLWTNLRFEVTHYTIKSRRLPPALDGLVIAQVSDLHNRDWGRGLTDSLRQAKPDLIVLTGDLIDFRHPRLPVALDFVREAAAIAPVYFVSGNHEARSRAYPSLLEGLRQVGVHLLNDRGEVFDKGQGRLRLLGLSDPAFLGETTLQEDEESTRARLAGMMRGETGFTLLLSHRPELFLVYAQSGVDLALTGHAHGGQVRLPVAGPLLAPNQGLFPAYAEGLITLDDTHMVVSRGLGNSVIPVRVNNTPELVVITLTAP